jgi:hypothetical protein
MRGLGLRRRASWDQPATRPSGTGGDGIRQGLGRLPAALAEVVEVTYFEGAPLDSVVAHLGISGDVVKGQLAQALGLLLPQVGSLIEESSP